jgi:hypothetical protein
MRKISLSPEWRRALEMLANARERGGITKAALHALGFPAETVESLVLTGLTTASAKTRKVGNRRINEVRLRITYAGRFMLKHSDVVRVEGSKPSPHTTLPRT